MFPTTMAVHAAVPRLFAFAGLPLSVFEFTVLTKKSSAAAAYQCRNNADHVVSREIVPTTRASQPSVNPLRKTHPVSERSVSQ